MRPVDGLGGIPWDRLVTKLRRQHRHDEFIFAFRNEGGFDEEHSRARPGVRIGSLRSFRPLS